MGWDIMDFVHAAQDGGQRWALLNMVVNLQIP